MVSDQPATFSGLKHCSNGDIMILGDTLFHKTTWSQDHVTLWAGAQPGSYHPVKLGGNRHCGSEGIIILVCHMILQYHVIKESYDFMG